MSLHLTALFGNDDEFIAADVIEADSPEQAEQTFRDDNSYVIDAYGVDRAEAYQFPFSLRDIDRAEAWVPDGVTERDDHYDVFVQVDGDEQRLFFCYSPLETRVMMATLREKLDIPCRTNAERADDS